MVGMREMRNAYRMSVRNAGKTRLFEEQSLTRKDNVAIDPTGIGSDSMD